MIGPEIHHDFAQLALGERGPHDRELLQLTAQLAKLAHGSRAAETHRVSTRRGFSLHALALAGRVAIAAGEIGPIVIEDLEFPLPRGEPWIGHMVGVELALDPAHHADPGDAVGFTRARAVREAIQRMER